MTRPKITGARSCKLGRKVRLLTGSVVGASDGFVLLTDPDGAYLRDPEGFYYEEAT